MSLKPIRPAPLPPPKNSCASSAPYRKHDDNNNKNPKQTASESLCPTVIRPKQNGLHQGRKKKAPPPRPAPPKVNRYGIGKNGLHGKQNSLHINSLLEEDLANIFGDCNNANNEKFKNKSQCQPISKKPSQPPRFVRRSMKKRAPNPLGNSAKTNCALIDFDSPVHGSTSSHNDFSQTLSGNFITAQEKSLLDLDDPFSSSCSNQVINMPKSNSLQIGSTFQDFPPFAMNGIEKCEKYVATINSVSYSQSRTNEQLQKKPSVALQSNFEYMGKENKVGSTTAQQPTIIYPVKSSKNNLSASQSDSQICSASLRQKQNTLSHSTVLSRSSQKNDGILYGNEEQILNVNWENTVGGSNCYNISTESDHCASPFSDISSHHTVSSVDSSDEVGYPCESLPEPEFPPPPPPPENFITESGTETTNIHTTSHICKALYDFEAESSEELSFKQGEFIHFEKKITDDWWHGYTNGQSGIFPSSFVEIVNNQKPSEPEQKQKSCIVTALYQFDGEEEGDLSFKADDEIRVLSRINKDWLFGECNGKQGQFPASFVKQKQANNNKGLCIARYPFIGENSDELSFDEGNKIIVTEYINDDWWRGMLSNNHSKIGIFPCAFVEKLDTTI